MADDELDRSLSEDGRAWDEAVGRLRESARAADSALRKGRPPVEGGEKAREEMAVRLRELMPASEALRSASAEVRDAWDARHAEIRGAFARAAEAGDVDALFDVLGWVMAIESAAAEPPELARSSACLVEWGSGISCVLRRAGGLPGRGARPLRYPKHMPHRCGAGLGYDRPRAMGAGGRGLVRRRR